MVGNFARKPFFGNLFSVLLLSISNSCYPFASSFVLPSNIHRRHDLICCKGDRSAMVEPGESTPLLLLSRLEQFGFHDDAKARLVLASQSPRRREILDMMMLGGRYTVETSPLDESNLQLQLRGMGITSAEYTRKLAEGKAQALAENHLAMGKGSDTIPTYYLGSDTVVELDGNILEKPTDPNDAERMLAMMSGKSHLVHTGVSLYRLLGDKVSLIASFTDSATVTFTSLSHETIVDYVATGEPLDKAGSYGIQGVGGQLVKSMTGDFFTVMGLPMHKTSNVLARALEAGGSTP